ncbi:glutamate 5-kinase [delta proteobacterium NaphS2]|nr:glutamate 5-kinase [delta proteobacterium NaphS2]
MNNENVRKELLKTVKRVVIKIGSGVLTGDDGLNLPVMYGLSADISALKASGIEVVLVSSGAIAAGIRKMQMARKPRSVSQQQATAAVGQGHLIRAWENAFEVYGHRVGQVLLTRDDLTHRRRYLNARNTIFTLLSWKIIPIVNENDTVVVDEIKFGDNDNLSAMVTNLSEADFLINLTNIDGLFDKDPRDHNDARLISVVEKVDRKITRFAGAIPGFLGRGGMGSKIRAAKKVAIAGVPTIIANGLKPGIIKRLFESHEEGTLFLPEAVSLCSRKHWIAFTKAPKGEIIIDRGAEIAIVEKGKSLLPSGIKEVRGQFSLGNSVLLINEDGEPVAVGMVSYHSGNIRRIMGAKSAEIESILGFKNDDEVIHRNNLVLTAHMDEGDEVCRLNI